MWFMITGLGGEWAEDIQRRRPLCSAPPAVLHDAQRVEEQVKTVGDKTKGVVAIAQEL